MDRCITCNSEDINMIASTSMEITDLYQCERCEQIFTKGDMLEVEEEYIKRQEKRKASKKSYVWYEICVRDVFGRWNSPICVVKDTSAVYEIVEQLKLLGFWESEMRVRLMTKEENKIDYICNLCVETKEGLLI